MKFKVLYTSQHLPPEAVKVLTAAHGGFAIDRRAGKGETCFALPGAGIIQISADLKKTRMLETAEDLKKTNLHNSLVWYAPDGTPYLTFPANVANQVFTTTLDGKLVHTLNTPTSQDDFDHPAVNDYFTGRGSFIPTDVEQLDGLLYITTGYSNLDYVLTADCQHQPFQDHVEKRKLPALLRTGFDGPPFSSWHVLSPQTPILRPRVSTFTASTSKGAQPRSS